MSTGPKERAVAEMRVAIERAQTLAGLGMFATAASALYEAGDRARDARAARDAELTGEAG